MVYLCRSPYPCHQKTTRFHKLNVLVFVKFNEQNDKEKIIRYLLDPSTKETVSLSLRYSLCKQRWASLSKGNPPHQQDVITWKYHAVKTVIDQHAEGGAFFELQYAGDLHFPGSAGGYGSEWAFIFAPAIKFETDPMIGFVGQLSRHPHNQIKFKKQQILIGKERNLFANEMACL